jgi:hypothetical protein
MHKFTVKNYVQNAAIAHGLILYPPNCPLLHAYGNAARNAGIQTNHRHAYRVLLGRGTPAMQALPQWAPLQAAITAYCD